jgi:hypothetical protein
MPVPQRKEPDMETITLTATTREPWNKGKLVGQKTPFKLKEIWAIRVRLQMGEPVPRSCPFQSGDRQQASSM